MNNEISGLQGNALQTGVHHGNVNIHVGASPAEYSIPAQLPPGLRDFTGRRAEIENLHSLLDQDRPSGSSTVVISAIDGTAGVGKTALAVHWAHQVTEKFPDGQLYVNLRGFASDAPMAATEALGRFIRAFGVQADRIPADLDEQVAMYRTLLTHKRVLVLLDNAESAQQVRPLLPASPACAVVITSRRRLRGLSARDGASLIALDTFASDEALALLGAIIGTARVSSEVEAARKVARLCAHLPLAIRIVAASLVDRPSISLADMVDELTYGDRLDMLGIDDDDEAAVRVAFDLSYERLPSEQRQMFRRLGLITGPDFSTDVAACLSNCSTQSAQKLLDRLAAANLIESLSGNRYQFHDLLRIYARARLEEEEDAETTAEVTQGLLDWYLTNSQKAAAWLGSTGDGAGGDRAKGGSVHLSSRTQSLDWLEAERASLVGAVHQSIQTDSHELAWKLAEALRPFLDLRKHWADWIDTQTVGRDAARRCGQPAAEARMLDSLGRVCWELGRYDDAVESYGRALVMRQELGDRMGEGETVANLGVVARERGEYDDAIVRYQQSLAIRREIGDLRGEGTTLADLGAVYRETGRYDEALTCYQEALGLNRRLGHQESEAYSLYRLSIAYCELGRNDEALECGQRALLIHRELGDRRSEARDLNNLGAVHREIGDLAEAAKYHEEALVLHRAAGHRQGEGRALNSAAAVYWELGRYSIATEYCRLAISIHTDIGHRAGEARDRNNLGAIYREMERYEDAVAEHEKALAIHEEIGQLLGQEWAFNGIGEAEIQLGRYVQALDRFNHALWIGKEIGHRQGEARALNNIGSVYAKLGLSAEAVVFHEHSLSIHRDIGYRQGEGRALNGLATAFRGIGDGAASTVHAKSALALFRATGYRKGQAEALQALGIALAENGQDDEAEEAWAAAHEIFESLELHVRSTRIEDLRLAARRRL